MAKSNRDFFDRYSVVHAALGALARVSRVPALPAVGGAVAFELLENPLKRATGHVWPDSTPDGWQNQAGDVGAFVAGYYGAQAAEGQQAGRLLVTALGVAGAAVWFLSMTADR